MQLNEISDQIVPREDRDKIIESITSRLAALEATEESSIIERGGSRILVASDRALLDCDFEQADTTRFKVEVLPWDAVPVPWIVYVGFLPWTDDNVDASFTFRLDPEFKTMYPGTERKVVEDFHRSALRHWRPGHGEP